MRGRIKFIILLNFQIYASQSARYMIYIFGELPVEEKIKANPDRDLGRVKSLPEWKILIWELQIRPGFTAPASWRWKWEIQIYFSYMRNPNMRFTNMRNPNIKIQILEFQIWQIQIEEMLIWEIQIWEFQIIEILIWEIWIWENKYENYMSMFYRCCLLLQA